MVLGPALGRSNLIPIPAVNMIVAFVVAAVSRVLAVVPGFIIGVPGGVEIDDEKVGVRERALFPAAGWVAVLTLCIVAWTIAGMISLSASNSTRILGIDAPYVHDFLLIVWLAGIEVTFFDMVPWFETGGQGLYRYSRAVWAMAFVALAFAAWHTLLNPNGDLIDVFSEASLLIVLGIVAAFAAGMLLFWLWQMREQASEGVGSSE